MFNEGVVKLKAWCGWVQWCSWVIEEKEDGRRNLKRAFEEWDCWKEGRITERERREKGEMHWRRKKTSEAMRKWRTRAKILGEGRGEDMKRTDRAERFRSTNLLKRGFDRIYDHMEERNSWKERINLAVEISRVNTLKKSLRSLRERVASHKKEEKRRLLKERELVEETFEAWRDWSKASQARHDLVRANASRLRKARAVKLWRERFEDVERRRAEFEIFLEARVVRAAFGKWLEQADYASIVNEDILEGGFNTLRDNVRFKARSRILNKRAISFLIFNTYSKAWFGLKCEWMRGRDRRLGEVERCVNERLEGVRKASFDVYRSGEEKEATADKEEAKIQDFAVRKGAKIDTSKYDLPSFEPSELKPVRTLQEIVKDVPEWIVDELGKRDSKPELGGYEKPSGYVVGVDGNLLDRVRNLGVVVVENAVEQVVEQVVENVEDIQVPDMLESAEGGVNLTGTTGSNTTRSNAENWADDSCQSPPRIQKSSMEPVMEPVMSPLSHHDQDYGHDFNFMRYEEIGRLEKAMEKLRREKQNLKGEEKKVWKAKYRQMVEQAQRIVEEIKIGVE
ncbi:hypothetical protein TrST_g5033 [Triparma strigata]|nr:hypothetical protein TrST_g5033 [Triparma strigata]